MEKILIVEDDNAMAELMRELLEISGFHVTVANDGDTGLSEVLSGKYSALLFDIMLPGQDGFSLCRAARESTDVPVLFVTARKEEIDKLRAFSMGADDYITKPFSGAELVARVKAHISRYKALTSRAPKKAAGDVITLRGLKIDPGNSSVSVNGRTVELSARECRLLLFLCRHPNHIFTKHELFQAVWDEEVGDENAVSVYMRRLRERIEEDPRAPEYLRTAWGKGYYFKV